jgi:flagellar basal-body rod protein FlgG
MTYNQWDLMIEGKGFFQVQKPNGQLAYTRTGAFKRDPQGRVVTSNGALLIPQIQIPPNAGNVVVAPGGRVIAQMSNGEEIELGQVQLHNFQNEEGLTANGDGIYTPTVASGQNIPSLPGENGTGVLQQGALEGSNVNVANSMVDMITTQRTYEMNTKVMSAADQMLGATVNIK